MYPTHMPRDLRSCAAITDKASEKSPKPTGSRGCSWGDFPEVKKEIPKNSMGISGS